MILLIAGFSVLSLALDVQTDIVNTQRDISDIEIKKQQEHFGVLASVDANDILSVNVQNQGQNSVPLHYFQLLDNPKKTLQIHLYPN